MKRSYRLRVAGLLAAVLTVSGCSAQRWFVASMSFTGVKR
jgi:hypothetical protein